MKIKCMITDDEPLARKGLRSYVEKIDFLSLIGECEDAVELNTALKTLQPDLVFLDIEMPEITGIELLSSIDNPPKVVIVSAYEQYALKGYELNVTDYLLKPVSFERFLKSVNKVHDILQKESGGSNDDKYIFVKSDNKFKKINLKDILLIESLDNYVIIHTPGAKDIVYVTLKNILESLPANNFIQVHRSYVINTEHVKSIEGNMITIGIFKIPISRNQRENVLNVLINNRLINRD